MDFCRLLLSSNRVLLRINTVSQVRNPPSLRLSASTLMFTIPYECRPILVWSRRDDSSPSLRNALRKIKAKRSFCTYMAGDCLSSMGQNGPHCVHVLWIEYECYCICYALSRRECYCHRFDWYVHLSFPFLWFSVREELIMCGLGMNTIAACFLIPVGVSIYVMGGGMRATLLCD